MFFLLIYLSSDFSASGNTEQYDNENLLKLYLFKTLFVQLINSEDDIRF